MIDSKEVLDNALLWLEDSFPNSTLSPQELTLVEIWLAIQLNYDGGAKQFVLDGCPSYVSENATEPDYYWYSYN